MNGCVFVNGDRNALWFVGFFWFWAIYWVDFVYCKLKILQTKIANISFQVAGMDVFTYFCQSTWFLHYKKKYRKKKLIQTGPVLKWI